MNNPAIDYKWMESAAREAWTEAQRIIRERARSSEFSKYALDPVAFCQDMFGDHYTDDVIRVMESVRDNPVTIARSGNSVGKTFCAAKLALWFYLVFNDAKVYLTAAPPLDNLRRILWGEIMTAVTKRPDLLKDHKMRAMAVVRHAQSFITGVAIPTSGTREDRIAKFSGKHAPHILFIVDEGDAVPDEIYEGIESCMSGGFARLLIIFNPKAQYGYVYQQEHLNRAKVIHLSALNHPNVVTGLDTIPGAVDRNTTLRRINEWTRLLVPGESPDAPDVFTPPPYLVNQTAIAPNGETYPPLPPDPRKIEENAFFYMVLGEYPVQDEMQLISQAWIDAALVRWKQYVETHGEVPPPDVQPILSIDVAEMGGDANVSCLRYGGYVPRMIIWSGIDTDLTATQSLTVCRKYNPLLVYVDATGTGSSVAPSISRQARAEKLKVRAVSVKVANKPTPGASTEFGTFYQLRDQLWWALREWLKNDPSAMLPPDPYLVQDLKAITYATPNGKIKIATKELIRKRLKRSPDRGDALALTFMPNLRPAILRLMD